MTSKAHLFAEANEALERGQDAWACDDAFVWAVPCTNEEAEKIYRNLCEHFQNVYVERSSDDVNSVFVMDRTASVPGHEKAVNDWLIGGCVGPQPDPCITEAMNSEYDAFLACRMDFFEMNETAP